MAEFDEKNVFKCISTSKARSLDSARCMISKAEDELKELRKAIELDAPPDDIKSININVFGALSMADEDPQATRPGKKLATELEELKQSVLDFGRDMELGAVEDEEDGKKRATAIQKKTKKLLQTLDDKRSGEIFACLTGEKKPRRRPKKKKKPAKKKAPPPPPRDEFAMGGIDV